MKKSVRKDLASFYGALSEESVDKLENSIKEVIKVHNKMHKERTKRLFG